MKTLLTLSTLAIGLLPMQGVLAIDVGTAVIALSILIFIKIPRPPRQQEQLDGVARKTSYWQDLRAGKWCSPLCTILHFR